MVPISKNIQMYSQSDSSLCLGFWGTAYLSPL